MEVSDDFFRSDVLYITPASLLYAMTRGKVPLSMAGCQEDSRLGIYAVNEEDSRSTCENIRGCFMEVTQNIFLKFYLTLH